MSFLKWIGISRKREKQITEMESEFYNEVESSVQAFNDRTIHQALTGEMIESTSDEELLQAIFDHLSLSTTSENEEEYQTITKWNKSQQTIYIIWCLESEINNGGFMQFYNNSSGVFATDIPDALRLVGATKFAELVETANRTYEQERSRITNSQDRTLEGLAESYEDNPLDELDKKFYELYQLEPLEALQIQYVRDHVSDFLTE